MARPLNLTVFEKMDGGKIKQIFEAVDESIVRRPLKKQTLDEITGGDLTGEDIRDINRTCINFAMTERLDRMVRQIDGAKIDKDKQAVLKDCLNSLNDRLSEEAIKTERGVMFLSDFGHPHISRLGIVSEFRSISNDEGKIIKIIPSVVFSGTLHNHGHKNEMPLNFQLGLEESKKLVNDMQDSITRIEKEVRALGEKFGDDVIAV